MALAFDGGIGESATRTSSVPATGAPLTLASWVFPFDVSQDRTFVALYDASDLSNFLALGSNGSSGDKITAHARNGGTGAAAVSTATYVANQWQHAAAVFSGSSSRHAYLDGVKGSESTTSVTPTGIDAIGIGLAITGYAVADGYLAEVAVWTAALTEREIQGLASGWSPRHVRPASLVAYYPLGAGHRTGGLTFDRWNGRVDLTENNSPSTVSHPSVSIA